MPTIVKFVFDIVSYLYRNDMENSHFSDNSHALHEIQLFHLPFNALHEKN